MQYDIYSLYFPTYDTKVNVRFLQMTEVTMKENSIRE